MADPSPPAPRRVGRPATIDVDAIVRAVQEIGLEDVTIRRVADHLGVSVPGLYHHVRGREDMLRLAAERSLSRIELPRDRDQTWPAWLREWARYVRGAMSSEPELVRQYIAGAIATERIVDSLGLFVEVLHRRGFTGPAALDAWETISTLALGSAIEEIRERAATANGDPWSLRMHRGLARHAPDQWPTLRALVKDAPERDSTAEFERHLSATLVGIAVRNGLPTQDVQPDQSSGGRE